MENFCKILIIDDEFIMRQGMKHMLDWEKEGFQIVGEATNGKEGLEMIATLSPHIILSDIVMPVLDGVDFSRIVQRKYPETQIIILSSFDNFEYVKSTLLSGAVDYILKPTLNPDILLAALKKAASKIPDLVLRKGDMVYYDALLERYLLGFDAKIDEGTFESYFPNLCFRLFGINLVQAYGKNKEIIQEIKEKIELFFLNHETYKYIPLVLNNEILCCILNYKMNDETLMIQEISQLVQELTLFSEYTFFVMGGRFLKIEEIKKQYFDLFLPVAESSFYHKKTPMLLSEEEQQIRPDLKKFDFTEYSHYLSNKQFDKALDMLEHYVLEVVQARKEEYQLKNLTKNLLYNMIVMFEEYHVETDDLKQKYFIWIDNTRYDSDFLAAFEKIIDDLKEMIRQHIENNDYRIKEILQYIAERYMEPLDLVEVSKVFNFNYYYLSSYFNVHAKEGFREYLNKIRIEKACELLMQAVLPISEVSAAVGYSDHSYFCRVFKKITGYTPSSYRRHYQSIKART